MRPRLAGRGPVPTSDESRSDCRGRCGGVDFRGRPTRWTPDAFRLPIPPFASAACRWTRTIVESILAFRCRHPAPDARKPFAMRRSCSTACAARERRGDLRNAGRIAPQKIGPAAVQNRFRKRTIVFGGRARRTFPARQQILDPLPPTISPTLPAHHPQAPPEARKQRIATRSFREPGKSNHHGPN